MGKFQVTFPCGYTLSMRYVIPFGEVRVLKRNLMERCPLHGLKCKKQVILTNQKDVFNVGVY